MTHARYALHFAPRALLQLQRATLRKAVKATLRLDDDDDDDDDDDGGRSAATVAVSSRKLATPPRVVYYSRADTTKRHLEVGRYSTVT